MTLDSMPVLIGSAQITLGAAGDLARSPQELLANAARAALADCGGAIDPSGIDTIAVIRTFADSAPQFASPFGGAANYPMAVARRIGAAPRRALYPEVGGNSPQMMVNLLAEDIRLGRCRLALIAGGEAIRSMTLLRKAGETPDWSEADDRAPETPGDPRPGMSVHELRHGIGNPSDTYPLFESALAAHHGRTMDQQRDHIAALFARFSEVAAQNPHAAMPIVRTAADIREPGPDNRMIAWPYTKYMNANMFVDQAAAILLCSYGAARAMGVRPDHMVFLAGSADLSEKWLMSERVSYHSSPAIRSGAQAALSMAGIDAEALDLIDLYSCFPCAVECAADAVGLHHDDPRGLTITGGLPFFGGPGNAYSLFAIAEMHQRLRGRDKGHGLVTANGWYLTKHSFGVYSSIPPERAWAFPDDAPRQAEIDAMTAPALEQAPSGEGVVEASTVSFSRAGPERGIIIGRLKDGRRFLANSEKGDDAMLAALMGPRPVGLRICVRTEKDRGVARLS